MVVGGVCKVIFMVNPTVVLRLGWGFDNSVIKSVGIGCAGVLIFGDTALRGVKKEVTPKKIQIFG